MDLCEYNYDSTRMDSSYLFPQVTGERRGSVSRNPSSFAPVNFDPTNSRNTNSASSTQTVVVPNDGRLRSNFKFFSNFGTTIRENEKNPKKKRQANGSNDHAPDKMKTKIMSIWNNVKYGLAVKMKTNFSKDSPIWILGEVYRQRRDLQPDALNPNGLDNVFREFQDDFYTRIWLTYRREFQVLDGSSLTTDCGWGCMLRSGQMLLAEGLLHHFMGREWRYGLSDSTEMQIQNPIHAVEAFAHSRMEYMDEMHRQIIRWFGDTPDEKSPFALHHLVNIGQNMGKKAGDWYGPASVAYILKHAMENAAKTDKFLKNVCVYVAQDCTIYKQDVLNLCTRVAEDGTTSWQSVIIFVPVRLGGETFNSEYSGCIKTFLSDPDCIGIIGGRPKHSLNFVGYQDDKLIFLDPHYCQEVVDVSTDDFSLQSFHCKSPRKMSISRMDPSCTIGFTCTSRECFDKLIELAKAVVYKHSSRVEYPVFVVSDGSSEDYNVERQIRNESLFLYRNDYEIDDDSELEAEDMFVIVQ